MEERRKQRILLLFSRAARRGENLAVSAQEAVTGGYQPGNMNTGTYCSVLSVELQNESPVDGGVSLPMNSCLLLPHTAACTRSHYYPATEVIFLRHMSLSCLGACRGSLLSTE